MPPHRCHACGDPGPGDQDDRHDLAPTPDGLLWCPACLPTAPYPELTSPHLWRPAWLPPIPSPDT